MSWYRYIRTVYGCKNCKTPLTQHANGQCMFIPDSYFTIEDYLIRQLLLSEGEDASEENFQIQKKRILNDFRRGVL
jgi:hypothetical protein